MFRIASFAALGGTSAKVLRDYDRRRLFRPGWVDPQTGYRLYSPVQLPELRRILALRDMGVSLDAIADVIAQGESLADVLRQRRGALEAARRAIDRRLAAVGIELDRRTGDLSDVVLRELRPQLVATLGVDSVDGDIERAFYELELRVRDAGVRASRPPGALHHHRGARRRASVEVFVPVRRPDPALDARQLPACRAATAIHRGSYATLVTTHRELLGWIRAAGLKPLDPLRVIYLQFGAESDLRLPAEYLVRADEDYVTELQQPIES